MEGRIALFYSWEVHKNNNLKTTGNYNLNISELSIDITFFMVMLVHIRKH